MEYIIIGCILDYVYKISTVLIAGFNAFFAVKVFKFTKINKIEETEKNRRLKLIKTLILDHNLKYFYSYFDKIENELLKLKENQELKIKNTVNSNIEDFFIGLRQKFYNYFLAIDAEMYNKIQSIIDELQSNITKSIFDEGVNLSHEPKYDELITEKIILSKNEVLKNLFDYR